MLTPNLPPGTTTLDVPVRVRTSGAFTLDVEVTSPDESIVLDTSTFDIRSTAISGVGLVLSVGAGLFLAVWWAKHWRSARRSRHLMPASSAADPTAPAPPPPPGAAPRRTPTVLPTWRTENGRAPGARVAGHAGPHRHRLVRRPAHGGRRRLGIEVVPLSIRFGSEEYTDGVDLSVGEFYDKLASAAELPETAAPSPGAFEAAFRRQAEAGADAVVCINLSSGLSATIQSAQNAAKAVADDLDVRVIDSR